MSRDLKECWRKFKEQLKLDQTQREKEKEYILESAGGSHSGEKLSNGAAEPQEPLTFVSPGRFRQRFTYQVPN